MEYWIRDLADMSDFSVTTLHKWFNNGFLKGKTKKRRTIIILEAKNIFTVRGELKVISELVKAKQKEINQQRALLTAKYITLENFANLWRFDFNKEKFTLNGYKVEYRTYRLGDRRRFDGKRYFIKNIDVQADFYSHNSKLKKLLKYEVQSWQK